MRNVSEVMNSDVGNIHIQDVILFHSNFLPLFALVGGLRVTDTASPPPPLTLNDDTVELEFDTD